MIKNEVVPDLVPEDIEHFYKVYAFITEEEEQRRGIVAHDEGFNSLWGRMHFV